VSATVFKDDQPPSTESTEVPRVNGQFEAPDEETPVDSTASPDLMLAFAEPETTQQAFEQPSCVAAPCGTGRLSVARRSS
jgi:hypothetical protein